MSNNINTEAGYNLVTSIGSLDLSKKSVLLVGAGWMATQHAAALYDMKINDVTIIDKKKENLNQLCNKFGYVAMEGDYQDIIPKIGHKDLVIVCTPIHLLLPAAQTAMDSGQTNILVEKPGSLYSKDLLSLAKKITKQRVRIAYNRFSYPTFHKLKSLAASEGGILSCHFTFTEWTHIINFSNNLPDAYQRWGISNSLHVISMAFGLVGMPKTMSPYHHGSLEWHKSGSIFTGSGITEQNIPFSYHANWESSGRWGIEVMTSKNSYRLIPLEELYVCPKGDTKWEKIPVLHGFQNAKPGLAEEISVMLNPEMENSIKLVTLEDAAQFNRIAEKIFGYDP